MDLRPIFDVSAQISQAAAADPQRYVKFKSELDREFLQIDGFFEKAHVQPCPVFFRPDQLAEVKRLGRRLHDAIETVVQMYVNGNRELLQLYSQYVLYRPLMIRQLEHFQVYGRYDFMVDALGNVVFLETNSAMPGGFIPIGITNDLFASRVSGAFDIPPCRGELDDVEQDQGACFLRMMRKFTDEPGAIAIVTDENEKYNEINLIRRALESAGLTVVVGPVDNLADRGGYRLAADGPVVTALYNKMRLFGSKHRWTTNSLSHHHSFLEAVRDNRLLQINNVASMTIIEDKAIFAALRLPSVRAALSEEENAVVAAHTPDSFPLDRETVGDDGRPVIDDVISNRDEWIVKSRNDYQGLSAHSGRDHSKRDWTKLVHTIADGEVPYLAQRRVDPYLFDVAHCHDDGSVSIDSARFAGGIYYRNGQFANVAGRASTAEIANVSSGAAYIVPVVEAASPGAAPGRV